MFHRKAARCELTVPHVVSSSVALATSQARAVPWTG